MIFPRKSFQKWILVQLLQLLLISIHNIDAKTDNDLAPWLVAIKVGGVPEWGYGSLITSRAVLTSANVINGVNKNSIKVMRDCEILLLINSPMEVCHKRTVAAIRLLEAPGVDKGLRNNVAILILNSPFNQEDVIEIAERFDDVNEKNCFFVKWDFVKSQESMVQKTITIFDNISLVNEKSDIKTLIKNRLRILDTEYAISSVTRESLKTQNGYNIDLDEFKEYLGNSLVCTLKHNSSIYVQIGVVAGYLTLQNADDLQLMIGVYYYDIIRHRSPIMELIDKDDDELSLPEDPSIFHFFSSFLNNIK